MKVNKLALFNKMRRTGWPILGGPLAGCGCNSSHLENLIKPRVQIDSFNKIDQACRDQGYSLTAPCAMMNLTAEAENLGGQVREDIPTHVEPIADSYEELTRRMIVPQDFNSPGIRTGLEVTRYLADNYEYALGALIGPLSLAGRLMGEQKLLLDLYDEPDKVAGPMPKIADYLSGYATALLDTGVSALLVLEPTAGLIMPEFCARFSNPILGQLASLAQDRGVPAMVHNCGPSVARTVDSLSDLGFDLVHIGNATDLALLAQSTRAANPDLWLAGNLEPGQFLLGSESGITDATAAMLARMIKFQNYIPSTGCAIPPGSAISKLIRFLAIVASAAG